MVSLDQIKYFETTLFSSISRHCLQGLLIKVETVSISWTESVPAGCPLLVVYGIMSRIKIRIRGVDKEFIKWK